jgi:hemerythrin superfamily protein
MARMISSGIDVVTFLKEQHEQIKMGFSQVVTSRGDQRQDAFYALRRLLAVHETAEEEIVHPAARSALPNGNAIVEARLAEENQAKKVLAELEELDIESAEFASRFASFQNDVIAHALSEEVEEFEPLASVLDQERLDRMRKAVNFAESVAPTRPHAGVESPFANMLVGPFASMLDRARDAISGKS